MTTPRAQNLLFTLYGDYLLARERPVWAGAIVTLMGQLDVAAPAVRVMLSRMVRRGWLTAAKRGSYSFYGLSRKGRALLESGAERIYHPPMERAWDGQWSVVTYSIPEERRPLRDALRVRLQWLGCGALGSGTWISPHDVGADVQRIADELKAARYIEIFRGAHLGYSDADAVVRKCWDLGELNRRYSAFIQRWKAETEHCRACGMTGPRAGLHRRCTTPAACFRRRFLLVHEYREFPQADPYLPAALLPDGWLGTAAVKLFEKNHDLLRAPAEAYVASVCDLGDELADAA